jgi:signal transduction histidine kinase
MNFHRVPSWLLLGVVLSLAASLLCWLLVFVAGDEKGMQPVLAAEYQSGTGPWSPWKTPGFANPDSGTTAWVKITLSNPTDKEMQGVLADRQSYADLVEFFAGANYSRAGEWVPPFEKAIWGRRIAFPVVVPPSGETTVFLKYWDHYQVWLDWEWWPNQRDFHAARLRTTLAESVYFGTMLALLFYNAVLWARLRFPDTGRYLLYLGSFTAFMFFGRSGPQMLGFAIGSPWMETIPFFFLALSSAFLTEFARAFLELPTRLAKADLAAQIVRNGMAVLAISTLAVPLMGHTKYLAFVLLGIVLLHIALIFVAVAAWRAGARQARYFMLSFGIFFVGFLPAAAMWLNLIALEDAGRIILIGSALEMMLLSVATADRFAQIQRDRIRTQGELLKEIEQRQTLQEAYSDELAVEVRERTKELEDANADKDRLIAILGHDLRSPLTGLTRTAEQLQSSTNPVVIQRFAENTALTGNQMLLLIEDMVLWERLRLENPSHLATHSVQSIVSPAIALNRPMAEQKRTELTIDVADDLKVSADLVMSQTLVRNLLGNAIKAARGRVTLTATPFERHVRISIQDDGTGLPAEILDWLRNGHGAPQEGLGLRLCKEIGIAIGSPLHAESPAGSGTTLSFNLKIPEQT